MIRPEVLYKERQPTADQLMSRKGANGEDPLYAPLGSPDAFVIRRGDLTYSLVKSGTDLMRRQTLDRDAEEQVFSCTNGLPANVEIRFAGHADFTPHESNKGDDVGTVARAGTRTVIHTGEYPIANNETIYFSAWPSTVFDKITNKWVPAIEEAGQPEDKFRPALFGLKRHGVYAIMRGTEEQIKGFYADNYGRGYAGGYDVDEWFTYSVPQDSRVGKMGGIVGDFINRLFYNQAYDLPARLYAAVFALYWFQQKTGWMPLNKDKHVTLLQKLWFNPIKMDQKQYLESTGNSIATEAHPIYKAVITIPDLQEYSREASIQAFSKQEEYLRSHCIGKCTRGGAAGQAIDIDIGYFF